MAQPKHGVLCITRGNRKGQRFILDLPTISIGRDPNNAISVRDIEVSRLHAQIQLKHNKYHIEDLDSSNGLFINRERVKEKVLEQGDLIRIGKTVFRFEIALGNTQTDSNVLVEDSDAVMEPRLVPLQKGLDVFVNISQAISQTRDLDELLKKILALVFEWTQADRACILLDEYPDYRVVSSIEKDGNEPQLPINISRTILDLAKKSLEAVVVSSSDEQGLRKAKSLLDSGINELVCMPIAFRGQLRGFIYVDTLVDHSTNSFCEEHIKMMAAIGQQTAVAIDNHLHYERVMETRQMAAVGEAMSGLSHHIKNILQGIHGGAHIVDDGLEANHLEAIDEGWAIVKRNQDKISELVLDMLSFSKSDELDLRLVKLSAIIENLVKSLRAEFQDDTIKFQWTANNEIDSVIVDRKAIAKAIENLLRNAFDACRKKKSGQIIISLKHCPSSQQIKISIKDNGCGISEENLPNIFSLFESTKGGRSTGIGLTVAQKLVREHQGDIEVTSAEGVGSTFTITLPHTGNEQMSPTQIRSKND